MPKTKEGDISDDDVVISGMAGVFPEALNVNELKEKLFNNSEFIKVREDSNWNRENLEIPRHLGTISRHDKFDASFFGVHKKQCNSLDSLLRQILERSFEAVVDAGLNPNDVKNSRMGVFMGTQFSDSETTWIYIQDVENGFSILGHNRGMLANRVSYWFNSYGPSYSFHSGDTCGIEGLSIAYDAIKKGYCETALVGTAAFAMHPEMSFHYKGLGILSEDGYNRSFDDDANGFVRSEALVVMYLQKAKDAKRIYASIVHSHAECYGDRKAGYIVPLEYPMTNMLRNFYQQCGIDPTTVSYLEADGSGIKARDAAELNAISNVLLRDKQLPLLIGSIKSNLGHASASAALVSIVKVLISMEAGKIPPNYNFNKPSKKIPALVEGKLKVVTEAEPWPGGLAAVNSVGLTGVYGHILLRSHSKEKVNSGLPEDDLPRLLVISGRTEEGLNDTLNKLESQPVDVECVRLLHDLYSSDIINFSYRGYTLIGGHDTYRDIKHYDGMKRPLWFIFSGMGSQWQEMGSKIIQIPIIFESIQKSHNTLKGKGIDLLHIITTTDKDIFDNILHSMVGITAIQIALVDFMRALNITPDGYIGHSVGELGCAYMDGCFTAEETILAAYYRGLASNETELIPGYMAAIGLGHKEIKVLCPPEVDVACHNSINSSTISGPEHIVIQFVNDLKKKDIFARAVNVANIAYHSRYIQPAAPKLLRYLKQLITDPKPRSSKWISSSVPESEWDTPLAKYSSPEYHTNNLLKEVLFEESTTHIPNNAIVIEIAPHGLLQAILRRSFGSECIHIPLTLRGHPNSAEFLLTAVGKMYEAGLLPKVSSLYAPVHYPVSRGTASLSSLMTWDHKDTYLTAMDMNTGRLGGFNHYVDQSVTINLNQKQFRLLEGHKISGKAILPLSYLLFMTWKYYCSKQKIYISETSVVFQNLQVHQHLVIPEKGGFTLSVFIQQGSGFFEIEMDGITLILSGQIVQPQNIKQEFDKYMTVSPDVFSLTSQEVYSELKNRGYQYTDQFRGILDLTTTQKGCVATVNWADNWCCFIDSLIQMVLFIDGENSHDIYLPIEIRKAVIDPSQHKEPRDIKAVYNNLSGVVRGGGVEIQGLKVSATKILKNNEASLKLESMTFLSHTNPRLKLTEQFVEVSMQIAFENISIPTTHKATIVDFEEESSLGNFTSVVKNILKKFHILKAEVKTVSLTNIKTITSPSSSLVLVITPISKLDQCVALLDGSSPFILARCPNQQKHKIHQDLVVVLQQQFNKEKLLLLRKAVTVVEKESVIKLTGDESTWLEQIKFAVDNGNGDSSRVYVVTNSKPPRKVRTLIQEVCKETKAKKLRYVLLIDKNAPDFCLTKDIYQHQLQQDLLFNFYVDGSWGSFQQLPINALPKASSHISVLPTLRIKHIQINFVGLNLRDPSIHDDSKEMGINDVGHLEIAGVTDDGRRVMSVVQNNEDVSQKYLDTYLTWDIPDSWSLEDAVTVPLAYATAYHCLIQTALLKSKETVLIHAGHTPLGQAAIALALHIGSTVFTTVTEIIHKEFLMKRFPQLQENNILILRSSFAISLMRATKGLGVSVIMNCSRGANLHISLQCLSYGGRFVQLETEDMKLNTNLGMRCFLNSTAFFGVAFDNLFNARLSWKKELHNAIQEGIKSGLLQPFERILFPKEKGFSSLRKLNSYTGKVVLPFDKETKTSNSPVLNFMEETNKIIFDINNTHLIIGSSATDCLDLIEWLVERNANKITLALLPQQVSALSERRLILLCKKHNTQIIKTSAENLSTLSGACSLIKNASKIGPLKTIFTIALNDDTSLHNLDVTSRSLDSLSYFVSLIDKFGEDISESRIKADLPILNVQWSHGIKGKNIRPIIKSLDQLLTKGSPPCVYVSLEDKLIQEFKEVSNYEGLENLLPSNLQELEGVGFDFLSKPKRPFSLVPSLSSGIGYAPEVLPIFIVPGIKDSIKTFIEPLAKNILYPTICIDLHDHILSLQDSAKNIVKHMKKTQPTGPYNLVGISWGGILAIEIARELTSENQIFKLFLLDGAPETTLNIIKQLGKGDELQFNLISRLMNMESNKVHEELIQLPNWKERVDYALCETPNISPRSKKYLASGLEASYIRINKLLSYTPSETLLSGDVHLILPEGASQEDTCQLKFFQGAVTVHTVDSDQNTLLSNRATADIINNEALVNINM